MGFRFYSKVICSGRTRRQRRRHLVLAGLAFAQILFAARAHADSEVVLAEKLPRFGFQGACLVSERRPPHAGVAIGDRFLSFPALHRELLGQWGSQWPEPNHLLFTSPEGARAIQRLRSRCRILSRKWRRNKSNRTPYSPPSTPNAPAPTPVPTAAPSSPVPQLALWQQHMTQYGAQHCRTLQDGGSFDAKLAATYYDAEWVFYQIGDYTGDSSWYRCARAAEAVYRDQYVSPNGGAVPGYWNFTHGLTEDALRSGDAASRSAVIALSTSAAYAPDATPLAWTQSADYSRETAYTIMAYLNAERLGQPRRAKLSGLVDQALGHMDQWFVTKNAPYVRPFMAALTAHALISYQEQIGDRNMVPVIQRAADWLWAHTWLPNAQAFMYTDRTHSSGGMEPAPDLNLLIAPVYAWLYHQTGAAGYRDKADQIFAGGVTQAYLTNGKQFNQSYRWSFAYLRWRNAAPLR